MKIRQQKYWRQCLLTETLSKRSKGTVGKVSVIVKRCESKRKPKRHPNPHSRRSLSSIPRTVAG